MTEVAHAGDEPGPVEVKLQLVWPTDVGARAQAVNQAMFAWDQQDRDMVYIYLGLIAPPPWADDVAEERAKETGHKIAVEPKGSFVMSRGRAEELWTALGKHLGKGSQ